MKYLSFVLWLVMLSPLVHAQTVVVDTTYYTPPQKARGGVLTADPDQNTHRLKQGRLSMNRRDFFTSYQETQTWYASIEGGFRSDISQLSNSFDGLVSNPTQTKLNWSLLAGYTFRNAWGIELGYTQSPIHLTISIGDGSYNPLVYKYLNNGYGIPLRFKRRIGLGKQAPNGTGFWLTGGLWLVPNGDGQTGHFRLIGYRGRARTDTIHLTNSTTLTKRVTGVAELGIDYTTRLSPVLELGFYARSYWGLGNALQADLVYSVNSRTNQAATITANGAGWGLGVALRYIYGKQQELKPKAIPYELYR